jgi:hypothetical protein
VVLMDQLFSNAKLFALCCSFGVNVFNLPDQCSLVCDSHPISVLFKSSLSAVLILLHQMGKEGTETIPKDPGFASEAEMDPQQKKKPSKPETIGYPRILSFASERACHHLFKR